MRHPANLSWIIILLSLALATVGWALKLSGNPQADLLIMTGTALVVITCTRTLHQLVRRIGLPVAGPLAVFCTGLVLLVLALLAPVPTWAVHLHLRLLGEAFAALGTAWLLVSLNKVWDQKRIALRRLRRIR